MNSKQALETLQDEINSSVRNRISPKAIEDSKILKYWNDRFDIIKKDLELLEELKLCFETRLNFAGNTYIYFKQQEVGMIWVDDEDNDQDLIMIKEWLNNDK